MMRAFMVIVAACALAGCASEKKMGGTSWEDVAGKSYWVAAIDGTPVLAGSVITVKFDDGRVSGRAQNQFTGSYTVTGEGIEIGQVASTKMFSDTPPGAMEQEGRFFAALESVDSWEWESGLVLRGSGRKLELMEGER